MPLLDDSVDGIFVQPARAMTITGCSMDPAIDYARCYVPVLFTKEISDKAKLIFIWLKFRGNSIGIVRWKYKDIADQFNVDERTIRRRLIELQDIGLIKITLNSRDLESHEIAIMPFTETLLRRLKAPLKWSEVRGGSAALNQQEARTNLSTESSPEEDDRQICPGPPALLSSQGEEKSRVINKTVNKTYSGVAAVGSEQRIPFGEIFDDPLVVASTRPKQARSFPAKKLPSLPVQPEPVIDDALLARWEAKEWVGAFVGAMMARGVDVSHRNRCASIRAQMTGVTNVLLERMSRMDAYDLLIKWFPKNFKDLCTAVFRKDAKNFSVFPLPFLESHLGELIERYKSQAKDVKRISSSGGAKSFDWPMK